MKPGPVLTAAAGLLVLAGACAPARPPQAITAEILEEHVRFLASDELAGRSTGTPGIARAEDYIAQKFKEAGLGPAPGKAGYPLEFPLYEHGFDERLTRCIVLENGEALRGVPDDDFIPLEVADDGLALGGLEYAGYGITAPEYGWDDYAGLDVRDKIVVVFRHEPARFAARLSDPRDRYSRHAFYATKIANAAAHGARGVLFVTDPLFFSQSEDELRPALRRLTVFNDPEATVSPRGGNRRPDTLPALLLKEGFAARILGASGRSPAALQRDLESGVRPAARPLRELTALVAVRRRSSGRLVPARNMAAFLPGRDPELKDQWIVVGAHHDHIGSVPGWGDTIYNGADDNASGVSGVLALAAALASRPGGLRRSVLFITFSAEEEGLLGAAALFARGLLPPDRFAVLCNLDMIGRNPAAALTVYARNGRAAPAGAADFFKGRTPLAGLAEPGNDEAMSDDFEFARYGTPTFFFFSGLHADYHGVDDEADRLDYRALEARVRLVGEFILWIDGR